jgi:hypothetical protein
MNIDRIDACWRIGTMMETVKGGTDPPVAAAVDNS